MKKILVVSATLNSNFNLALDFEKKLIKLRADVKVISLEDFPLPLYTSKNCDIDKNDYLDVIKNLTSFFIQSHGILICSPEYNGSIPPIVTNAISWISVSTDYWRDAFMGKTALITTSSGGAGSKFLTSMKIQLEHLGAVVLPESISTNRSTPLKKDSTEKILKQFINLI